MPIGVRRRRRAGRQLELEEDVADVTIDRALTDRELACDLRNNARIVAPHSVFGSQAFLISRPTVEHLIRHWKKVDGMQDIKISRLAGLLRNPIFYHAPSLVQHIGVHSVWGGSFHQAMDFDSAWTA